MTSNLLNPIFYSYYLLMIVQFPYLIYKKGSKLKLRSAIHLILILLIMTSFYANFNAYTGLKLFKENNYHDSIRPINKVLKVYEYLYALNKIPKFYFYKKEYLLSVVGIAYHRTKDFNNAISYLGKSLEIDEDQFIPRAFLAHSLFLNKQFYLAEEQYDILFRFKEKKNFSYYLHVGMGYANTNRHKEAIESLEKALELKPQRKDIHYLIALSYDKLNAKNEALNHLKELPGTNETLKGRVIKDPCFSDDIKYEIGEL